MKLMLLSAVCASFTVGAALCNSETFVNPVAEGADPWVVKHNGKYVWCFSEGNRGISVWVSDRLTSIGARHVVWEAPESGPVSREVWAPEMHSIDGKWYIYFAASDGRNENHLAYALESAGDDPLGPYELHGPFATGAGPDGESPNIWAIDMTVLEHDSKRYAIWSGWDAPGTDRQFLYIAPLASPVQLGGPRVLLTDNATYLWERTEEHEDSRGLNEAPQVLKRGDRTFVTYSCGASWKGTYKLGLLELTGNDPLDPGSWDKHPEPIFRSSDSTIGVGHSTYVRSPDDEGFPMLGEPTAAGKPLPVPSGQVAAAVRLPLEVEFGQAGDLRGFSYFGHQQFLAMGDDGVHLGVVPDHPVNDYRSGEKLVLNDGEFSDLEASVKVEVVGGDRDAGLLFRIAHPAVGFDAQQGYFAGIVPGADRVLLGKTDGQSWQEIARTEMPLESGKSYTLGIRAKGDQIVVHLDGQEVITASDSTYRSGAVGLRVVDTHARFSEFSVRAAE